MTLNQLLVISISLYIVSDMNARYARVSLISPPISNIRYENPPPIRSRYPIFRTLLETWHKKEIGWLHPRKGCWFERFWRLLKFPHSDFFFYWPEDVEKGALGTKSFSWVSTITLAFFFIDSSGISFFSLLRFSELGWLSDKSWTWLSTLLPDRKMWIAWTYLFVEPKRTSNWPFGIFGGTGCPLGFGTVWLEIVLSLSPYICSYLNLTEPQS